MPRRAFAWHNWRRCRLPDTTQSLLDAGCGSGILAIAAGKLGYSPVIAFDFDPDAVRVARENAAANAVTINISRQDLTKLPVEVRQPFDVVCANSFTICSFRSVAVSWLVWLQQARSCWQESLRSNSLRSAVRMRRSD